MKYRFFQIPALDPGRAADELNQFLASHAVIQVDRHLVADGSSSFWAFCASYWDGSEAPIPRKGKVDYREVLDERDFAVYARLRALRKELAEREGLPPYALFTNEQLAAMVQRRPGSLAELGELAGVGKARVERYGEAFLAALSQATEEGGRAPDAD